MNNQSEYSTPIGATPNGVPSQQWLLSNMATMVKPMPYEMNKVLV
jgi:hypothetical protein